MVNDLVHEITNDRQASKHGICSYINETAALQSLLYDIDRMPEQWIYKQTSPEWRQMAMITVAWCKRDEMYRDLIRDAIAINNESDSGDYDRMDAWEARAKEAL